MYTTTYSYNSMTPTAHVTVRKNRVKQYGGAPTKVYLKDNQEFEIELFNAKATPVMAKIKLNGQYISTKGIYLKPGQRVFLDRFIDDARKFTFSTYVIDNNDTAAVRAIANNGDLSIEFYDEVIKIQPVWFNNSPTWVTDTFNTMPYSSPYTSTNTGTVNQFYCSSVASEPQLRSVTVDANNMNFKEGKKSLETGRIEAGSSSNQKFEQTYGDFNSWYTTVVSYKILPDSHEPVKIEQVVTTSNNFCGNCGTKITKSHYKFCPNCGERL